MFGDIRVGIRRVAVVACAVLLVACAGTSEQGSYKQLSSADVTAITQSMTREQVEQKLGPSPFQETDRQGNQVLKYRYSGTGSGVQGVLWVTINPASGKVIKVDALAPHN